MKHKGESFTRLEKRSVFSDSGKEGALTILQFFEEKEDGAKEVAL